MTAGFHPTAFWISASAVTPDCYGAFRGTFRVETESTVTIRICGAHVFTAWLDGVYLAEGPWRFPPGHAEYETLEISVPAGSHVLAALVRHEGINTRLLQGAVLPPFLFAQVQSGEVVLPISWKAIALDGYLASGQRVSPQFAWIEWVDTQENPADWEKPEFDDSAWSDPVEIELVQNWTWRPVEAEQVKRLKIHPRQIGTGRFSGPIEQVERPDWRSDDDLPWYHRNLQAMDAVGGTWRRYDLGQVRLGRPEITLDLPPNTVVEIAYAEALRDDRVIPFIPLSCGLSRNLDHFVARGGPQTFTPVVPKGGRYLEIHIGAAPEHALFLEETYWQRTYYAEPVGTLHSGDELLDRIWQLGIDTLRSCSEDAIIDNPTRERGQWTGDILPALPVAAAGYNDVRLFARSLRHSAWCANSDGLVAGLCPGEPGYLSTYAAQWTTAVVDHYLTTGDQDLLEEFFPYAVRNLALFARELTSEGVRAFAWPFVDWGYPGSQESSTEMGLNLHFLGALKSMQIWCDLVRKDPAPYAELEVRIRDIILTWLMPKLRKLEWRIIGYQCATLALHYRLVPEELRLGAVNYLKAHMQECFPNDREAPSLVSPEFKNPQLITPYFAYYSLPPLVEAGEMDFVLDQYRTCWGWPLARGLTTQPEVFDLGWSHCHIWGSSPTAQLSRYLLGLRPRFGAGLNHFEFTLMPGNWKSASGQIPLLHQSGAVSIAWNKIGTDRIEYEIESPEPIWINFGSESEPLAIPNSARLVFAPKGPGWQLSP